MQIKTLSKDSKESWLKIIAEDLKQILEDKSFEEKYPDFIKHAKEAYDYYSKR